MEEIKELTEEIKALRVQVSELKTGAEPLILTSDELCDKLRITSPTLLAWRRKGKVPFLCIGKSIRYNYNEVLKAVEKW